MEHKSGFVNIIGNPNVGKSTLMNALVGEKISIITSKAQTTRHRILGIVNADHFQIVYSDTPGIIMPKYELQRNMMKFVRTALVDADIILYVTDTVETIDKNESYINKLKQQSIPVIVVINKIDITSNTKVEELTDIWRNLLPHATILPVSALKGVHLNVLFDKIMDNLPEGAPYYPKDAFTDKSERFFVSEIIREKILLNYQKEIPYSVEIEVESFKEAEDIIRIRALIYVARNSQKGIIIGHKGEAIKKLGIAAREDLETFFEKQIYLELFVKIRKGWRDNQQHLKKFGYKQ
jgi:GTP-binding protein Era